MIKTVYKWDQKMVMVFDEHGEQLPEYQGKVERVRELILRDASAETEFFAGTWRAKDPRPIEREEF